MVSKFLPHILHAHGKNLSNLFNGISLLKKSQGKHIVLTYLSDIKF
jgi:hypothetical protein